MSQFLDEKEQITQQRLKLLSENGVEIAGDALNIIEKLIKVIATRDFYLEEVLRIHDETRKQAGF